MKTLQRELNKMRFEFTLKFVMAGIIIGCTGQTRPETSQQTRTSAASAQHTEHLSDLDKLLSQAICPCDKRRTLLDCYQDKSCEAATNLGEHAKELLLRFLIDSDACVLHCNRDAVVLACFFLHIH